MERARTGSFSGWGGFPAQVCHLYRPEKRKSVVELIGSGREPSWIARGLGRSYGDTALNQDAGVLGMERLDRMISFDPSSGLLDCDAGVSFRDLIDVFLPLGHFPPVTPGTQFITVGGAIANDVHGKNHHVDGTFERFVESLELLLPSGEIVRCSRVEEPALYAATVGGIGLTGVILSARFRLRRVETSWMLVDRLRVGDLDAALTAMEADDEKYPYSVAWIDCLATGGRLGRSILIRGRHATRDDLPRASTDVLSVPRGLRLGVPFWLPSGLLNRYTVSAFNAAYYAAHPTCRDRLESFETFFYPLDAIRDWNRIYGRRGFVQYQVVFPTATARRGLIDLIERISAEGRASFLAVLKRFGPRGLGLLSFPFEGFTLSLDIPVCRGLPEFLRGLDRIVVAHAGRLYLGKDATMSRETLDATYPEAGQFRSLIAGLGAPGRMSSSMARRLDLVPT